MFGAEAVSAFERTINWILAQLPEQFRDPVAAALAGLAALAIVIYIFLRLWRVHLTNHNQHLRNKREEVELQRALRAFQAAPVQADADAIIAELERQPFSEPSAKLLAQFLTRQSQRGDASSGPGASQSSLERLPATFIQMAQSDQPENRKALSYLLQNEDDKALQNMKQIAERQQDIESWRRVADVAYARNIEAAIEAYEKVDSLSPNDLEVTLQLSRLYSRKGQSEKALAAATKAREIARSPEHHITALTELSSAQRRTGRIAESRESADRAVQFARTLTPNIETKQLLARALLRQAVCRHNDRDLKGARQSGEEAEALMNEVVKDNRTAPILRDLAEAAWSLVTISSAAGSLTAADQARQRMYSAADAALTLDPADTLAASQKFISIWWDAHLLLAQGKIPQAREAAARAREASDSSNALDYKGIAPLNNEYWAITIQARVETQDAQANAAIQLLREALDIAERAHNLDSASASEWRRSLGAKRELAMALWGVDERDEALALMNQCIAGSRAMVEKEASLENIELLISCLSATGELEALKQPPATETALKLCEEAVRHSESLSQNNKNASDCLSQARWSLAHAMKASGNHEGAVDELAKALQTQRERTNENAENPALVDHLASNLIIYGDFLMAAGRTQDARIAVEEAVRLSKPRPDIELHSARYQTYALALDRYANFFEADGDTKSARELLTTFLDYANARLAKDPTNKVSLNDKRWGESRLRKLDIQDQLRQQRNQSN